MPVETTSIALAGDAMADRKISNTSGGKLTNSGTITCGLGGYGHPNGGNGGNGVYLDSGTLANSGAIIGGARGAGWGGQLG